MLHCDDHDIEWTFTVAFRFTFMLCIACTSWIISSRVTDRSGYPVPECVTQNINVSPGPPRYKAWYSGEPNLRNRTFRVWVNFLKHTPAILQKLTQFALKLSNISPVIFGAKMVRSVRRLTSVSSSDDFSQFSNKMLCSLCLNFFLPARKRAN